MESYAYTVLGTLAALLVLIWAMAGVGKARGTHGVDAPATSGHPDFERAFRAHQNTLEQIVIFLPLLWLLSALWGDMWGGIFSAIWVIGRILYVSGYRSEADKRSTGFLIAGLATLAALLGCIVGTVMMLI